jgi:hypothetical protein
MIAQCGKNGCSRDMLIALEVQARDLTSASRTRATRDA